MNKEAFRFRVALAPDKPVKLVVVETPYGQKWWGCPGCLNVFPPTVPLAGYKYCYYCETGYHYLRAHLLK